jgi:hypothetical protein
LECEWKGEEKCNELRTEAAAARAGMRVFELSRRLRSERAIRTREVEGVQSSCMFVDVGGGDFLVMVMQMVR